MERVPEPELMNDIEQVRAYALADFEEPHSRFITLVAEKFPQYMFDGTTLDLGCGPGDVTCRFAHAYPQAHIDAIDGAENMLLFAQRKIDHDHLHKRIRLFHTCLPQIEVPCQHYDAVISNSLLHHLADPQVLWQTINTLARPQAPIFVMDLMRPPDVTYARDMVHQYAGREPSILRTDFYNSLLAAYHPAEVGTQLKAAGLDHLTIEAVSDRHLIIYGRK